VIHLLGGKIASEVKRQPLTHQPGGKVKVIHSDPQTLSEMFLVLLEDRFPWLGTDDPADGADTVEQLSELHQSLLEPRSAMQSDPRQ
jgi:hypothetical protein